MQQPAWNFEQDATDERMDETGYNLRAYFDRMADDKLREYSRAWSDAAADASGTGTSRATATCCCPAPSATSTSLNIVA